MKTNPKIITHPLVWLIGQVVVLAVVLWLQGDLEPKGLQTNDDSREYLEQSQLSFRENLSRYRTVAYPLFLRGIQCISPNYAALPLVQLVLHALAVVCFYGGLRQFMRSSWLALAVASSLLYSNTFLQEGTAVLTDAPASSLAIATIGLLLWVVARPQQPWTWAGLTLGLFLTYQTRPAYQFLLLLVPVLGVLLATVRTPAPPRRLRHCLRVGAGLLAVCFVPFLTFCTLRAATVSDFGLVSFDGYNLAGVAGQLLTEDLVPQLPEDVRPLARRVIEMREWTAAGKLPPTFENLDKNSLFINDILPLLRAKREPPTYNDVGDEHWGLAYYLRGVIERAQDEDFQIDRTVWVVCLPAAQEFVSDPKNSVELNRQLRTLSKAVLKARPLAFLKRGAKIFGVAMVLTLVNGFLLVLLLGVLLMLGAARQVLWFLRHWRETETTPLTPVLDYYPEYALVSLIAVSFTFGSVLLVGLISQPLCRYTDAAGVFLPTMAVVALFAAWEKFRGAWTGGQRTKPARTVSTAQSRAVSTPSPAPRRKPG